MGNTSSNNPFNPYSHRIELLKRVLRDKTNQDEQIHSDIYGQDQAKTHPFGGIDDNGTGIYPVILTDVSGLFYPDQPTTPINPDENGEPYLATRGLNKVIDNVKNNINDVNYPNYTNNVIGYYNSQQDIFGQSRDNQKNHDNSGSSYIKQITDLSGQILKAQREQEYLKTTELTGMQFAFEALKEQNNSLNNQINENVVTHSKDSSKVEYQIQQNNSMKIFNSVLLIVYGLGLLVLASILFGINARFSLVSKIGIIFVFMLFPFCFLIIQQLTESIRSFVDKNYPNYNVYFAPP
jgi:hypothetical protein